MTEDTRQTLSKLRKRREVVRASITRLSTRLRDLESTPDKFVATYHASQLSTKLETLDVEFRSVHLQLVDLIDDGETKELRSEQEALDRHDDEVTALSVWIQQLISRCSSPVVSGNRKASSRKLLRLEKSLKSADEALAALRGGDEDTSLIEQHREQLTDYKKDLATVYEELVSLDLDEEDDLFDFHAQLEKVLFKCSHTIKKLLNSAHASKSTTAPVVDGKGVKLPKLDVPTFNGDLLQWKQFWEQFLISVHDRGNLSNAEKLVYLRNAVKDGSAKNPIEDLSRSGDHYQEAIDCLKARYDRPRLIHRAHVRMIAEAPALRDGGGKELRRLHNTMQQHLCALKAMDCEPSGSFITSVIELKLECILSADIL